MIAKGSLRAAFFVSVQGGAYAARGLSLDFAEISRPVHRCFIQAGAYWYMNQMRRTRWLSLGMAAIALALFTIMLFPGHSDQGQGHKKLECDFPELVSHVDITHHWDAGGRDVLRIWRVTPKRGVVLRDVLRDFELWHDDGMMASDFPRWWPDGGALSTMACFYQHRHAHWRLIWHNAADDTYYLQWYDT